VLGVQAKEDEMEGWNEEDAGGVVEWLSESTT